ncbi:MAG: LysR substrate-binding domain-containing protein [Dongiaceae bacterium]
MLNSPDPDLLHTFAEIVEHGSFTRAALRVHRTQSAVSMQIRRLEQQLGCRLFQRAGRRVALTAQGELFYDHARRILRAYRDALAVMNGRTLEGDITVGLPDDLAGMFLPRVLPRFSETYPWIRLSLVCEPSRRLIGQVADGVVDLGLVTEGEGATSGVVVRREPLAWASSARHEAHGRDPIPLAIFHTGDVFRRFAVEQLAALGRHARIAVTSPSFAGIAAAVEAGIAVAVVFQASVRPGWRILGTADGFPALPDLGIVMLRSDQPRQGVIDRLADCILESAAAAPEAAPATPPTAAPPGGAPGSRRRPASAARARSGDGRG